MNNPSRFFLSSHHSPQLKSRPPPLFWLPSWIFVLSYTTPADSSRIYSAISKATTLKSIHINSTQCPCWSHSYKPNERDVVLPNPSCIVPSLLFLFNFRRFALLVSRKRFCCRGILHPFDGRLRFNEDRQHTLVKFNVRKGGESPVRPLLVSSSSVSCSSPFRSFNP